MQMTTREVLDLDHKKLLSYADPTIKEQLGNFVREFNKREWSVRIGNVCDSFEDYAKRHYEHQDEFGVGFVVNDKPVPYFHPNRSFHDEIIWLNNHLYYRPDVTFGDKLINSAVVKFYGPARTLDIITGNANLDYLDKTDYKYINFDLLRRDERYEHALMSNIEKAFAKGEKIWGTTELRTSLQTASRDYSRKNPSIIDRKGVLGLPTTKLDQGTRGMRPSDMINWISAMSDKWITFYKNKPDMEESFNFLTSTRGIGNYYGYHFSSNLARMPGVGHGGLIQAEWSDQFKALQQLDPNLTHGNLDENSDYVIAGPGSTATIKSLFPQFQPTMPVLMHCLVAIRDNQEEFFDIAGKTQAELHLKEASELGRFTTFGIEISCCQFNVFRRVRDNPTMAMARAKAPISKISKLESVEESEPSLACFIE